MEPELEPAPAAEVAPAAPHPAAPQQEVLEHAVEIVDGEHTKYPAALASHERVLQDKELFLALLQDLCTKLQDAEPKQWRPTKFRVPTAAGQDLDLQRLYRLTTELGGAVEVTDQARWPDVIKPMNFPSKVNTAAIRKIYSQLLWHFEQVYFNGAAGQPLDEPPEFAAATAAAAAVAGGGSADRGGGSAAANGAGRARPARSRKGPSLAALLAAEDQISSGLEEPLVEDYGSQGSDRGAGGSGDEGEDPAAAAAAAVAEPAARKPMPAALLSAAAAAPASTASPSRGSAPPQAAAAAANGVAPPQAAPVSKPRSRPSQQRQGVLGALAPGRTPELTAFHKQGRHRRDLTGATVTGKVEARFDCGYFVSITVGGMQFGGVLYCPAGTGTAAAGAGGAQGGQQQASRGANRQDGGTGGGGDGGSRRPPAGAGSSAKREVGAAGLEEGGASGSRPAAKRRRSYRDPNDPTLANKPKSAKTAFNFFAAEQWASLRGELGANAAPQDISRLIGERWNKATEEERAPYVVQAQQDKTRYEREMETWRSELEVTTTAAAAADSAAADAAAAEAEAAAAAAAAGVGSPDAMDVDPATVAAVAAAVVKAEQRSATPPRPHHPKIKLKMHGPNAGRGTPPPAAAPGGGGYAGAAEHGLLPQQLHTGGDFGSGGGAAVSPTLPAAEPYLQPVSLPAAAAAAAAAPASPVLGGAAGLAADGMAVDAHAPPSMHAAGPGGDMQL